MDKVYLTSDVLVNKNMPEGGYHSQPDRAKAVFDLIYRSQLTAYVSDVVLLEATAELEKIWPATLPSGKELSTEDRKRYLANTLLNVLAHPNIQGIDLDKWETIYNYYGIEDVSINEAYHVGSAQRIKESSVPDLRGIASFNRAYDKFVTIPRIEPFSSL